MREPPAGVPLRRTLHEVYADAQKDAEREYAMLAYQPGAQERFAQTVRVVEVEAHWRHVAA